jgi:hypothetical protein
VLHEAMARQKVTWGSRRYYFNVCNTLYINYKFGTRPWRLALGAAAFVVRGVANGIGRQAVKGVWDSVGMMRCFARAARPRGQCTASPPRPGAISARRMCTSRSSRGCGVNSRRCRAIEDDSSRR